MGRGSAHGRAEMSSATLPNTLPAPTTATFATHKSPTRSAGVVAVPPLGERRVPCEGREPGTE